MIIELELSESLSMREFRLELAYSAARLSAEEETRHLARDFDEAGGKLALLEEEQAMLDLQKVQTQAMVEIADDRWDDTMRAFEARLLDLSDRDHDHAIYRQYFADIPSGVTSLSYAAEVMISKDLETALGPEKLDELRVFSDRLREARIPLEAAVVERTRLEVAVAKFQNRVHLAQTLSNKLRRITFAALEELSVARDRSPDWCGRFFRGPNRHLEAMDSDGAEQKAHPTNGHLENLSSATT